MKKHKIICLCAFVYFVSYFSRKNFAIIMNNLLQQEIIAKSTGGLICLALFVCYGVGQIISGYLGDKIEPKKMIITGLLMTACCNLLMISTINPVLLIIFWGINGLAQAMLWPPIVKILSINLDNENFVKANLAVTSAAHISTILLYLYVPLCLLLFNWKFVFISAFLLALITALIFLISINKIISTSGNQATHMLKSIKPVAISTIFKETPLVFIFIIIIAMGFLRDGIETWLPTLYQEVFNRNSTESILISVILPIFSILSISITTTFHKNFKCINNEINGVTIYFMIAAFVSLILIPIINNQNSIIRIICLILSALICAIMHGCNFLLISCIPGRFKNIGRSASISGFCNAFTYVGAAISTYGFALISSKYGWKFTIISWLVVAIIGITFSLFAKKQYRKFINENS